MFSHFARMPNAAQLGCLESALSDGYIKHPSTLVTIHVMDPEELDVRRDSEMRAVMKSFTERYAGKLHSAAVIIPSRGFATALLRALVAGAVSIVRRKSPTKVFATVGEATTWVESRFSQVADVHETLTQLAQLTVRTTLNGDDLHA